VALSKLDMLIIRACKSKDPHKRLMSVYRRFYYNGTEEQMYQCFIPFLAECCAWYNGMPPDKLIALSCPEWWQSQAKMSWAKTTGMNLVSAVRNTLVSAFPEEMIWPVCYLRIEGNDE